MRSVTLVNIDKQLHQNQVRKCISWILQKGKIAVTTHAKREMANDNLIMTDIINVLRCGQVNEPGEFENNSWRYRVHTSRICVVVAFRSETVLVVVTAWRKK